MSFLKSSQKKNADYSAFYSTSPNALSNSLVWLLRLRWIAVVFLGVACFPALRLALLRSEELPTYLGTLFALVIVNLVSQKFTQNASTPKQRVLLLHLCIDVLCLSSILALMGGAWNPLSPLLYFHAALGGLLLRKKNAWVFLSILSLCFLSLNLVIQLPPILEASPVPRYIQLPSQLIVAFSIWALTRWLSEKLEDSYIKNRAFEDQKLRLDKLRAAGALSAGFSHEFATPLNTLKMRMERIFRKNEIDPDDESISKESLEKCEEILRKMSASNTNKESIRIEKIEIEKLLREIINSWNSAQESPKIEFLSQSSSKLICEIPSIPFTNSILALFDNAKEANALKAKVTLAQSDAYSIIQIVDTGSGWPNEVKKHFGQPFLSLKKRGSGLGLYNAKTLIEALGGSLEIQSSTDTQYPGASLIMKIPFTLEVQP